MSVSKCPYLAEPHSIAVRLCTREEADRLFKLAGVFILTCDMVASRTIVRLIAHRCRLHTAHTQ